MGAVNAGADEFGFAGERSNGTVGFTLLVGAWDELPAPLVVSVADVGADGDRMSAGVSISGALLASFGTSGVEGMAEAALGSSGAVVLTGGFVGAGTDATLDPLGTSGVAVVVFAAVDSDGLDLTDEFRIARTNNTAINPKIVALYKRFELVLPPTGFGVLFEATSALGAFAPKAVVDFGSEGVDAVCALDAASGTAAAETMDGWTFCNANNTGTADVPCPRGYGLLCVCLSSGIARFLSYEMDRIAAIQAGIVRVVSIQMEEHTMVLHLRLSSQTVPVL